MAELRRNLQILSLKYYKFYWFNEFQPGLIEHQKPEPHTTDKQNCAPARLCSGFQH